jgi:hypothetical protein
MSMTFFRARAKFAVSIIVSSVATGAVALPAYAGSADGAADRSAQRAAGEWDTTLVLPKPSMRCKQAVKVAGTSGDGGAHSEARHNAIESWRSQVTNRHGHDYAHWWRANEKDVTCRSASAKHTCEALAAPCMAEPGSTNDVATRSGLGMNSGVR